MKLNFYFFGDVGVFDKYNPAFVLRKKHVDEIIYLIGINEPFSITKSVITTALKMKEETFDELIENLILIDAIEEKENRYRLMFPLYFKRDIEIINGQLRNLAKVIGDELISLENIMEKKLDYLSNKAYGKKRLLYHIVCDQIFDGTAFDYFAIKELIATSQIHPSNRDYIIVGYEDNDYVNQYSDHLLCSSNNFVVKGYKFNSFGDSNGNRKDMYRYFRLVDIAVEKSSDFTDANHAYISVLKSENDKFIHKCGDLLSRIYHESYHDFTKEENKMVKFLESMEYLDESHKLNVPVFIDSDFKVIDDLSEIVLNHISPNIEEFYQHFNKTVKNITPIKHNIDIQVIANELWHLIFGSINEYLVETGFVENVKHIEGEGRYLRSFTIL